MRKEVTKSVCERIMSITDRVKELVKEGNNGHELIELDKEFWGIKEEYDLFDRVFEEDGKKGVVDILGNVVVPPLYEDYAELYNYSILAHKPIPACDSNDKYALVTSDGKGTPLCAFEYDMLRFKFGGGCLYQCWKRDGEKFLVGVIDREGNMIVPCEMDEIYGFCNNYAVVEKGNKVGAVTAGGFYIEPLYDDFEESDGFLTACKDGVWGYISAKGEFIDMADEERLDEEEWLCLFGY